MRPPVAETGPVRVALVSVGIGRVQRGFERYFGDLFGVMATVVAVTLFKSGGAASPREQVPAGLRGLTRLIRALPRGRLFDRLFGRSEYHRDCLAFALCLLPQLRRGRFEVVHCIDPPLAAVLALARRLGVLRVPLLFTEGSVMPPTYYPRVDHIHHVGQAALQAALAHGVPAAHMTLIPCGLHTQRFAAPAPRATLRRQAGVGEGDFLVLCVAALKRDHKRVDHVIDEVAQLGGQVLLWLDGHPEDAAVATLARQRFGARCRISHVASDAVAGLYAMADVLVHAALEESFGLSLVEAQCAGLPVVAHDSPHFRWLLGADGRFVDMRARGALAQHLQGLQVNRPPPPDVARIQARYDWSVLRADHAALYQRVAAMARK
jgi:glycosyltransferase involved in cell wall biosynthesis